MRCFHFYIDDWLASKKVGRMDAHEERGYLRLILHAASEPDCGLPTEEDELADIALLGGQWYQPTKDEAKRFKLQTSGSKILACFDYVKDGRLFSAQTNEPVEVDARVDVSLLRENRFYNQRLLREFQYQQKVSATKAAAGKRGAQVKHQKREEAGSDSTQHMPEDCWHMPEKIKQAGQQNTSNLVCVWVCVSGYDSEEVNGLLNGGTKIDLDRPVQTRDPDDLYLPELMAAAAAVGLVYSPAELQDLRNAQWRGFGLDKRREAVKGILTRLETGEHDECLLGTYILEERWERSLQETPFYEEKGAGICEAEVQTRKPVTSVVEIPKRTSSNQAGNPAQRCYKKFIEAYPNKTHVDGGEKAFLSIWGKDIPNEEYFDSQVMPGLTRWRRSRKWEEDHGKYVPNPITFLIGNDKTTGRMWKDYPEESDEYKSHRKTNTKSSSGTDPHAEWEAPWKTERGA